MPPAGSADIADPAVAAAFDACPPAVRKKLLALRTLILTTAAETPGVGDIVETLKWGQPSYLTPETKSGTTIRIDQVKGEPGRYALYVNCQTSLIETFRALYPDALSFEGTRGILFDAGRDVQVEVLRHCIALALTYHRDKPKPLRASRAA